MLTTVSLELQHRRDSSSTPKGAEVSIVCHDRQNPQRHSRSQVTVVQHDKQNTTSLFVRRKNGWLTPNVHKLPRTLNHILIKIIDYTFSMYHKVVSIIKLKIISYGHKIYFHPVNLKYGPKILLQHIGICRWLSITFILPSFHILHQTFEHQW